MPLNGAHVYCFSEAMVTMIFIIVCITAYYGHQLILTTGRGKNIVDDYSSVIINSLFFGSSILVLLWLLSLYNSDHLFLEIYGIVKVVYF